MPCHRLLLPRVRLSPSSSAAPPARPPTHPPHPTRPLRYAALASFADVLTIEALVETVFLRGMVMQNAVPRDATGRSDYGMVAANPGRVSRNFTSEQLETLVSLVEQALPPTTINNTSGGSSSSSSSITGEKPLIQIVNYNVRGQQYVVAGELLALDALSEAMTAINKGAVPVGDLAQAAARGARAAVANQAACARSGVPFSLRRGSATIPLPGIDVPFHSRKLLGGVPAFRQLLEPRLDVRVVAASLGRLLHKYIPNVIAEPFALDRGYFERVLALTGSPALGRLLAKGKEKEDEDDEFEAVPDAVKARTLLVELLAHQFAMPVLWITTQDVMFHAHTQRLVEMGPAATLATMAKRSLEQVGGRMGGRAGGWVGGFVGGGGGATRQRDRGGGTGCAWVRL
jgi:malonyl CoA-acyl carrier protein transacylase